MASADKWLKWKEIPSNLTSQYAAEIKGWPQERNTTQNCIPFVFIIILGRQFVFQTHNSRAGNSWASVKRALSAGWTARNIALRNAFHASHPTPSPVKKAIQDHCKLYGIPNKSSVSENAAFSKFDTTCLYVYMSNIPSLLLSGISSSHNISVSPGLVSL